MYKYEYFINLRKMAHSDTLILNKYVRPTALDRWHGIYCIEENNWSEISNYVIFIQEKLNCKSFNLKIAQNYTIQNMAI